jgi:hypothetical protein
MSINEWQGNSFPLPSWLAGADQAVDTAQVIADKTTSIVVRRNGADLAAQIVRIEELGGPGETRGQNATVANAGVLIVGYRGHPTIADTDLKRGDRFYLTADSTMYTVTQILVDTRESLQVIGEVSQGA